MADVIKRKIEEADQFVSTFDSASDLGVALNPGRSTGFFSTNDTSVSVAANNETIAVFTKGQITLSDNGAITGSNNSIFISGNTLQFQDGAGNIRRLDNV